MRFITKIYANLIGNWVCLNDDPDCKMGTHMTTPNTWWEENAEIFSPITKQEEDTLYHLDSIWIHYKGSDYRINPIFVQVVLDQGDL